MRVAIPLAVACAPSTAAPEREEGRPSNLTEPIQGGSADDNDDAVGLLRLDGDAFCSGTLIAPDVVLTAAHCVEREVLSFDLGSGRPRGDAATFVAHDVDGQRGYPGYAGGSCPAGTFDIGLVHLTTPIDGVTPVAYADALPERSTVCRVVGFGRHDIDGGITELRAKRQADVILDSIGATYVSIRTGSGHPDNGDSGGPLVCGGILVATCSCHTRATVLHERVENLTRIDTDWIDRTIRALRE